MKKEVENKKSFITDLPSSESSGDESEKELPIENKGELKKYLLESDDKLIKKNSPRKQETLSRKEKLLLTIMLIKIKKNQLKNQRIITPKTHPRKVF